MLYIAEILVSCYHRDFLSNGGPGQNHDQGTSPLLEKGRWYWRLVCLLVLAYDHASTLGSIGKAPSSRRLRDSLPPDGPEIVRVPHLDTRRYAKRAPGVCQDGEASLNPLPARDKASLEMFLRRLFVADPMLQERGKGQPVLGVLGNCRLGILDPGTDDSVCQVPLAEQ